MLALAHSEWRTFLRGTPNVGITSITFIGSTIPCITFRPLLAIIHLKFMSNSLFLAINTLTFGLVA